MNIQTINAKIKQHEDKSNLAVEIRLTEEQKELFLLDGKPVYDWDGLTVVFK